MRLGNRLSANASLGVLAALLVTQPLFEPQLLAQAFNGAPTTTLGTVTYNRTITGSETITIDSAQAAINWSPTDTAIGGGAISFLQNGNTANYVAGTGAPGGAYTVLNRIIAADPTRAISFDGAINSAAGGAVWFYAPGGILIGANARFNVGSLLLTANDLATDGSGNFLQAGNRLVAQSAANSTAAIQINAGAQINALNGSSYVIAIAPRVIQAGAIQVDGSAALVAAEAVDLTINAGLFDITVTQGTTATGNAISHTGSTGGPASTGGTDYQRIYMVAVPKNDALALFVGGNLGFDVAGALDVVGNTIVLSAGHNVVGTATGDPFSDQPVNAVLSDIRVETGSYTSALTSRATNFNFITSFNGNLSFASDVSIRGGNQALIEATAGHTINLTGNAVVSALAQSNTLTGGTNRTGGTALAQADSSGSLLIGGDLTVNANGVGDAHFGASGASGSGTGGTARVQSDGAGSTLTVGGFLSVMANGSGRAVAQAGDTAGSGTGGTAQVFATTSGNLGFSNDAEVLSLGFGGANAFGSGGTGTGGTAEVNFGSGGTMTFGGSLSVDTSGAGGTTTGGAGGAGLGGQARIFGSVGSSTIAGLASATSQGRGGGASGIGNGGTGTGGTATINLFGAGSITGNGGGFVLDADGLGGAGNAASGTGGNGAGGTASIVASNGTMSFSGPPSQTSLSARGVGAAAATGGNATGGTASVTASGPGVVTLAGNTIVLAADTRGGAGAVTTGGGASGGSTLVQASGGGHLTINGEILARVQNAGGNGPLGGGTATGGTAVITSFDSGSVLQISNDGTASAEASALGGNGTTTGAGGNATGGTARIVARLGGSLHINAGAAVSMDARGGDSVIGTAGTGSGGGFLNSLGDISADSGATLTIGGGITGSAIGNGGFSSAGASGNGNGGRFVLLNQTGASVSIGGSAFVEVQGYGGGAGSQNNGGGNATGGTGQIGAGQGTLTIGGDVEIDASTLGGNYPGNSGFGGSAVGGTAILSTFATGGSVVIGGSSINLSADAGGGIGDALTGTGGNASAGFARIFADGGTIGTTASAGTLHISGSAIAGNGATGGVANGGRAFIQALNGGSIATDFNTSLLARTTGGIGSNGSGGNATGFPSANGNAVLVQTQTTGGTLRFGGSLSMDSATFGGNGTGGVGGNATGADSFIGINTGSITIGTTLQMSSDAFGGNGATGGSATAGSSIFNVVSGATTGNAAASVGGSVTASVSAFGGNAVTGAGGAATAGTFSSSTRGSPWRRMRSAAMAATARRVSQAATAERRLRASPTPMPVH
jgi:filamentous hemagglutinin family protein